MLPLYLLSQSKLPIKQTSSNYITMHTSFPPRRFFTTLKGLSHEGDLAFDDMYIVRLVLGQNRGWGHFFNFLSALIIL